MGSLSSARGRMPILFDSIARPITQTSDPGTKVTECTGYIGNSSEPSGFSSGSSTSVPL
jgi:hypothetical protein